MVNPVVLLALIWCPVHLPIMIIRWASILDKTMSIGMLFMQDALATFALVDVEGIVMSNVSKVFRAKRDIKWEYVIPGNEYSKYVVDIKQGEYPLMLHFEDVYVAGCPVGVITTWKSTANLAAADHFTNKGDELTELKEIYIDHFLDGPFAVDENPFSTDDFEMIEIELKWVLKENK